MKIKKIIRNICSLLTQKNEFLSSCESASAGNLSSYLTMIDGSSKYFKGSLVCYSNEVKHKLLKIDDDILKKEGAVSETVAKLMSINTNQILNTDWCISITGNASRKNLIEKKQSCLYFVGISYHKEAEVHEVKLKVFSRRINQQRIAKLAIKLFYKKLKERI